MEGLYFKYQDHYGYHKVQIDSFEIDGKSEVLAPKGDAGDGREFTVKCECGSNDWSDNGRFINEYECNCCGQYVTIYGAR